MSDESLQGLNCPQCGGRVPVPEGQWIVRCPYCDLRSFVRGERGLLRYQTPQRVERPQAEQALKKFLTGNWAIAPVAARQAQLQDAFLMFLPFWAMWADVIGWIFGQKQVGSGDHKRYEPREVRMVQQMSWNGAACEVGEFGVGRVKIADDNLQAFDPESLHQKGMVFEPVGLYSEAEQRAQAEFEDATRRQGHLDRIGQVFTRALRRRSAIVYHPLWVMRYLFRGRAFQVVVDGVSGQVLYGKAPGNTLYRAAILVFGMALGAFVALDVPAGMVAASDDGDIIWAALVALVIGFTIMFAAYRTFRMGEQYEFRKDGPSEVLGGVDVKGVLEMVTGADTDLLTKLTGPEAQKWLDRLN